MNVSDSVDLFEENQQNSLKFSKSSTEIIQRLRATSRKSPLEESNNLSLHQQEVLASKLVKNILKETDDKKSIIGELPPHLLEFKNRLEKIETPAIKLPLIGQLSPRTKKKLALIPPPNAQEKAKINKIEEDLKKVKTSALYDQLSSKAAQNLQESRKYNTIEPIDQVIISKNEILKQQARAKKRPNEVPSTLPVKRNVTLFDRVALRQQRRREQNEKFTAIYGMPMDTDDDISFGNSQDHSHPTDDTVAGSIITESTLQTTSTSPLLSSSFHASHYPFSSELKSFLLKKSSSSLNQNKPLPLLSVSKPSSPATNSSNKLVPLEFPPSPLKTLQHECMECPSEAVPLSFLGNPLLEEAFSFNINAKSPQPSESLLSKQVSIKSLDLVELDKICKQPVVKEEGENQSGCSSSVCSYDDFNVYQPSSVGSSQQLKQEQDDHSITESLNDDKSRSIGDIGENPSKLPIPSHNAANDAALVESYLPVVGETVKVHAEVLAKYQAARQEVKRALNKKVHARIEDQKFFTNWKTSLFQDLGLDVDPDFTRRKLVGRGLLWMFYSVYVHQMTDTWAHWRSQTAKMTVVLQQKAGFLLTRVARGMLARKLVHARREIIRIRKFQEKVEAFRLRARYNWCMFCLRETLRKYVIRRKEYYCWRRLQATMNIQRVIRGFLGRRKAHRRVLEIENRSRKVLIIQSAYRQHLARRRVLLYRKLKLAEEYIRLMEAHRCSREDFLRKNGAKLRILQAFRAFKLKKKLKSILYWHRYEAIINIQKCFRGYQARKVFRHNLKIKRARDKLQYNSATCIQCMYRCFHARRVLRERFERKLQIRERRKYEKSRILQQGPNTSWSFFWYRYWLDHKKNQRQFLDLMAIRIQKIFRGLHARRHVFAMRVNSKLSCIYEKARKHREAIVTIQRHWRGFLTRNRRFRQKMEVMALKIQCRFRCFRARKIAFRKREQNLAMGILERFLRRFIRVYRTMKARNYERKFGGFAKRIQRRIRLYLSRIRRRHLIAQRRSRHEFLSQVSSKIEKLLLSLQIKMVSDSLFRSISQDPPLQNPFSSYLCPYRGVISGLFVCGAVTKGLKDPENLNLNRCEASALALFCQKVEGLCVQGRPEMSILLQNTQDGTTSLSPSRRSNSRVTSRSRNRSKGGKNAVKVSSLLFQAIRKLVIPLTAVPGSPTVSPLASQDIDTYFGRSRNLEESSGQKSLNYLEFCRFLQLIANHFYGVVEVTPSIRSSRMRRSSSMSPMRRQGSVEINSMKDRIVEEGEEDHNDSNTNNPTKQSDLASAAAEAASLLVNQQRSLSSKYEEDSSMDNNLISFESSMSATSVDSLSPNHENNNQKLMRWPWTLGRLFFPVEDVAKSPLLSLTLKALVSHEREDWMNDIVDYLEKNSKWILDYYVIRIQNMARCRIAWHRMLEKKEEKRQEELKRREALLVIRCQSFIRQFLARRRLSKVAQRILMKYIPFEGRSYYYHPYTKVTSFVKPRILGLRECRVLPLPPPQLDFVIPCGNGCQRSMAEVNCCECEDSFCRPCFESLHAKGQRRSHHYQKLTYCGYCQRQMATKSCLSCVLCRPKKGGITELIDESHRGTFCDSCFSYVHHAAERWLDADQIIEVKTSNNNNSSTSSAKASDSLSKTNMTTTNNNNNTPSILNSVTISSGSHLEAKLQSRHFLFSSSQAFLVRQELVQPLGTMHRFDHLVQACEECSWRAAGWRCIDCGPQLYCSLCFVGLHSLPGPFRKHHAERLPYYTPEMHCSFQKDFQSRSLQQKLDVLRHENFQRRQQRQLICAVKIQAWWRGRSQGYLGKMKIRQGRRRLRRQERIYREETRLIRSTPQYQRLWKKGRAPPLPSDRRIDSVLRQIPASQHEEALYFIEKNMEDWGFYRQVIQDYRLTHSEDPSLSKLSIPEAMKKRKGIPRSGFEVGAIEELVDQGLHGGFRMPGRIQVIWGQQRFRSSMDLRPWLKPGYLVRIGSQFMAVVKVQDSEVTMDRVWRQVSSLQGEILYRLPMFQEENYRWKYRWKYLSFEYGIARNPLSLTFFYLHRNYFRSKAAIARSMMRMNARSASIPETLEWKQLTEQHLKRSQWSDNFLRTINGAMIDFAEVANPELIRARMDNQARVEALAHEKEEKENVLHELSHRSPVVVTALDIKNEDVNDISNNPEIRSSRPQSGRGSEGKGGGTSQPHSARVGSDVKGGYSRPQSARVSEIKIDPNMETQVQEEGKDGVGDNDHLVPVGSNEGTDLPMDPNSESAPSKASSNGGGGGWFSRLFSGKPSITTTTSSAKVAPEIDDPNKSKKKKKKGEAEEPAIVRPPGVRWFATKEEVDARRTREEKMSREELAKEAHEWEECLDPMTENVFFVHKKTLEILNSVPKSVAAYRHIEEEKLRNQQSFDTAQNKIKGILKMKENRIMINGRRKR